MSCESVRLDGRCVRIFYMIYALAKELTTVTDNVITFLSYTCLGFSISFFRWIIQQDVGWATGELQQQVNVTVYRCIGTKLISNWNVPFSGYLLLSCLSWNTGKIYENYKMQGSYRFQCCCYILPDLFVIIVGRKLLLNKKNTLLTLWERATVTPSWERVKFSMEEMSVLTKVVTGGFLLTSQLASLLSI